MSQIYLTPASISYLNQFILALLITLYLGARFFSAQTRQSLVESDHLLFGFFVSVTVFSLALFFDASLLPTERLLAVYSLNSILAILLVLLIQLAYSLSHPVSPSNIERWLALLVSLGYLGWELAVAVQRYGLLSQGKVIFRIPEMDYGPVVLFFWVVFVFGRATMRNWRNPAIRRFALIFVIPLVLATLNILRSYALVSTLVYHVSLSVGILAVLFLFALNYLLSRPETTTLMVKFSGAVLTVLLALLGGVAWLVTPAYADQYHAPLADHRSIRFVPNSLGGYDVIEIPFQFEKQIGNPLSFSIDDAARDQVIIARVAVVEFPFLFYGKTYSQVFVANNGLLTFGTPPDYPSLEHRFSRVPAIFALYSQFELEPNPPGGIYLRQEADRLIVTYNRVRSYYVRDREYTFQVVLYADGQIDLTHHSLPAGPLYQVNERPDASVWAIGLKPASEATQTVSLAQLPLRSGPQAVLDDQYRAFRQYIHEFLVPLIWTILLANGLLLFVLPLMMLITVARPLKGLMEGVQRFEREQRYQPIPVQFQDEIGYLTDAFNRMGFALNDLLRNLEMRVADRTANLLMANEELRKLSVVVEQSPSIIIITSPQAEIEYVNESFTRVTGYTLEEVKGKNPRLLQSGQTPPERFAEMWATLTARQAWRGELINRRKNGEVYWELSVIAPILDKQGNITHYVAIKEDITARKLAEAKLEMLTVTDPLTSLLNRRGFFLEAEKFHTQNDCISVLMIDIDHFKMVNDRYGHLAGDAVLREVAARLRTNLYPDDILARYGGEEFVVLLPCASAELLQQIATRLVAAVGERPMEYDGTRIAVTISVGGVQSAEGYSLDDLLSRADRAMYQAKEAGRNCVRIWHEQGRS